MSEVTNVMSKTIEVLKESALALEKTLTAAEALRLEAKRSRAAIVDRDQRILWLQEDVKRLTDLLRGSLRHVALNPTLEKAILKELGES